MEYLLIVLAGFAGGFINVIAGGGSMITLPALTLLGFGMDVANGTNRIGILMQNIAATYKFSKSKITPYKKAVFCLIPAVIGAVIGTVIAVQIDQGLMKKIVGFIFLGMSILVLFKPNLWEKPHEGIKNKYLSMLVFFLIGIYGGFIQAGVGIFIMLALVLLEGLDLLKTNSVKVLVILGFTLVSLIIFALNGKVDFLAGIILGIGSMTGGYVSAKLSIKKGTKFIRYILFAVVILSAIKYIFFS